MRTIWAVCFCYLFQLQQPYTKASFWRALAPYRHLYVGARVTIDIIGPGASLSIDFRTEKGLETPALPNSDVTAIACLGHAHK